MGLCAAAAKKAVPLVEALLDARALLGLAPFGCWNSSRWPWFRLKRGGRRIGSHDEFEKCKRKFKFMFTFV